MRCSGYLVFVELVRAGAEIHPLSLHDALPISPATTAAWAWILSPSASASGSDNGTAGSAEGGTGGLGGRVVVVIMGSKQGRRTSIRDQPTRPLHHTTPQAMH